MPSLRCSVLAVAAALASAVRADYYIDPNSVSLTLRKAWCTSEISTCPLICDQTPPYSTQTLTNTCDPETLTYGCVCSDGLQPNVSEYSLTLPYFVCQQWGTICVTNCGQDNTCASSCREDHPCGALNPSHANATSSSSAAAAATATGSSTATASDTIYTGLGTSSGSGSGSGSSSGSSSTSRAGRAAEAARSLVGVGLTLGGLAAGFALL